jgi:hypothetical protein
LTQKVARWIGTGGRKNVLAAVSHGRHGAKEILTCIDVRYAILALVIRRRNAIIDEDWSAKIAAWPRKKHTHATHRFTGGIVNVPRNRSPAKETKD